LILVPALITLAVTIVRLLGELLHWPTVLFNPAPGGGGAIVGIAWLPFIFGPYFAVKLSQAGQAPARLGKMLGITVLCLIICLGGVLVVFAQEAQGKFSLAMVGGYLLMAASAVIPLAGWSSLTKALLAYAYAARIPVAIVMFFAIRGGWGTHYDGLPPGYPADVSFWSKYVQVALLPQLIFWVAYTVLIGALVGIVATAIVRRFRVHAEPPA